MFKVFAQSNPGKSGGGKNSVGKTGKSNVVGKMVSGVVNGAKNVKGKIVRAFSGGKSGRFANK